MRLREILTDVATLEIRGNIDRPISELTFDSRKVSIGSLFFALTGLEADGHDYIKAAVENGAKCIVHEKEMERPPGVTFIRVKDSREAMSLMASNYFLRPSYKLMTIGVTGTDGKTSTARILHAIMSRIGPSGLMGTAGHIISGQEYKAVRTTPESIDINSHLLELVADGAITCILEVSSHAVTLHRTSYLDFDIAVFTNLSRDHLDFHRDMEDYFSAKAKLFSGLKENAFAVINLDDAYGSKLLDYITCEAVTYSFIDRNAVIYGELISSSIEGIRMNVYYKDELINIFSPLFGEPNAYNILAAIGAALSANCDTSAIQSALKDFKGVRGRFERIECGKFSAVIDYAHTARAVETAGSVLRKLTSNKLHIVLGCGGNRDRAKRPLMAAAAEALAGTVYITSDNPRNEDPQAIIDDMLEGVKNSERIVTIHDRKTAIHTALNSAEEGDIVAILGKGHEDYQEADGVFHHFDDKEVVIEWLVNKNAE